MMDPQRITCRKCTRIFDSDWSFCAHCGQQTIRLLPVQSYTEDEHDTDSAKEKPYTVPSIHVIEGTETENETNTLDGKSGDLDLITELEIKSIFEKVEQEDAWLAIQKKIYDQINEWRKIKINIAVTGMSGCGKSTLINTLRGLKSDDTDAANIGLNETTTKPTSYPHPNNSNLVLWDLPGVGTDKFPKETYLDQVKFDIYDFIILLSCTRFTALDKWLAMEINSRFPNTKLFFVRTKIDFELIGLNAGRNNRIPQEQLEANVAEMAKSASKYLIDAGIQNFDTFMINGNDPCAFDFRKLIDMFVKKVSALKREALVLSENVLTQEVVKAKIEMIMIKIKHDAKQAAVEAAKSNREKNEYFEVKVLEDTIHEYQRQLGIDKKTVESVAKILQTDYKTICSTLNSDSDNNLNNFMEFYKPYDKVKFSYWDYLPILGKFRKVRQYQEQCVIVLNKSFQYCVNDNKRLRRIIQEKMQS